MRGTLHHLSLTAPQGTGPLPAREGLTPRSFYHSEKSGLAAAEKFRSRFDVAQSLSSSKGRTEKKRKHQVFPIHAQAVAGFVGFF
jgi:hypothetical protein